MSAQMIKSIPTRRSEAELEADRKAYREAEINYYKKIEKEYELGIRQRRIKCAIQDCFFFAKKSSLYCKMCYEIEQDKQELAEATNELTNAEGDEREEIMENISYLTDKLKNHDYLNGDPEY